MKQQAPDTGDSKAEGKASPLYLAIFDALRAEIEQGGYLKAFPSEAQLVRRFAASRQTVIQAMRELVKAGLVERHRGSGTVVSRRIRQLLGRVGLILPGCFDAPFTDAFSEVCKEVGYTFKFSCFDEFYSQYSVPFAKCAQAVSSLAREFAEENVLGVLLHPVQQVANAERINREILAEFRSRRIPVVLVDHDVCLPPEKSGCDVVGMDNFHAGYIIGRHLVERGAKKIAFLTHDNWAPSVMDRLHGVAAAVSDAGLAWNPSANVIHSLPDDAKSVTRAIRALHPDAIACGNDVEAARLLKTLAKLGISVPGDIRVTGVDDLPQVKLLSPPLTTLRQGAVQIARVAAERLIWRIHHPFEPPVTIQTHGQLIVRKST